ncbi:MAG: hypothetical protein II411_02450 [Lachnospiraceae bacterium]|nr:hypothetical protein [Lachnospiraceae bacterium]
MRNLKFILLTCFFSMIMLVNLSLAAWVQEGEFWKYEENGVFKTNDWLQIEGDYYYFDATSHMVKGLQKIGSNFYVFHNNGVAYKKKEKFNLNGVEYDIATKGKVKDLENDMTDAEYAEYVSLKALEEANNKKFQEAQNVLNESIAAENAKREKEQAAIRESQKAVNDAEKERIERERKLREDFLLSPENDAKLIAAANKGNASKPVVDNVTKEIKNQVSLRKIELLGVAKKLRQENPMAELDPIIVDFNDIIDTYAARVETILDVTSVKYKVNDEKMEGYVEQFATMFNEMKASFAEALDKSLG